MMMKPAWDALHSAVHTIGFDRHRCASKLHFVGKAEKSKYVPDKVTGIAEHPSHSVNKHVPLMDM